MKSKKTKRALVSSALALVLCFVMLLGTTFAWFTDNASTSVNKVQAGTLDVALEMSEDGGTTWQSAEGKELKFLQATETEGVSNYVASEDLLWEPGAEYKLPDIRIANKGNLALKYQVAITAVNGDTKLAEVLDVKLQDGNGSVQDCGTLKSQLDKTNGIVGVYSLAANTNSNTLHISLKMQESAGNTYQGLSIDGIAITVMAKQDTVEYDSSTNEYDANATYATPWDGVTMTEVTKSTDNKYHITTAAQFAGMMEVTGNSIYAGETIVLDADIDFGGQTIKGVGSLTCNFSGTFDGQGHTVSNFVIDSSNREYYAGLFNQVSHGGKIMNLTVKDATIKGKALVGAIASSLNANSSIENCKAYNCTLIGTDQVGAVAGGVFETCSVTNCYAENCEIFYSDATYQNTQNYILGYKGDEATDSNNTSSNVTLLKATLAEDAAAAVISGGTYKEYTTVSDAAKAATEEGSTIKLLASISETLPVPSADNVTYTAAPGVVLSGGAGGSYWDKSTTFDGLTFKGGKGISVTAQQNVSYTIQNCTFDGVTATAWKQGVISVNTNGGTATVTVTGNTIRDVKNQTTDDGRIDTYGQQSDGIYINAASGNVTVSNNVVEDVDGTGIYVKTTGTVSITGNVVSEWGTGATAGTEGRAIRTDGGSSVTITGNKLLDASSNEEYIKAENATTLDVSGNYWGGNSPENSKVFNSKNSKSVTKTNYYSDSAMKTLVTCQ